MSELYTCSYYAWRPDMGVGVRITAGNPRFMSTKGWIQIAELKPRREWFNLPPDQFEKRFRDQLDRHERVIRRQIAALRKPAVLCCFERKVIDRTECHRLIFAEWWRQKTGVVIPELDAGVEKKPQPEQIEIEL